MDQRDHNTVPRPLAAPASAPASAGAPARPFADAETMESGGLGRENRGQGLLQLPPPARVPLRTPNDQGEAVVEVKEPVRARAPAPPRAPGTRPIVERPQRGDVASVGERSQGGDGDGGGETQRKGLLRRHPLAAASVLLLLVVTLPAGYLYWDYAAHFETTDDAFVAARQFAVAPKVAGYLTAVPVSDNQHLVAGEVVARIDDRDYRNALAQAQAQVAAAQANIGNIDAQLRQQQAQITADQANVAQAKAALVFAQQQAGRYAALARTGAGTVQNEEQFASQLRQNQASLASTQAMLEVAQRQVDTLKAQRASAVANLGEMQAQRDQAELNLSYTVIRAAQPGRVVNLSAAVGAYAAPGTALAIFVPDQIWVTANFKETQLDHMRPGQPVTLAIDAYPERTFRGHVDSVQPGPGTAFSLLPAQNATGNFVKIVQRVPVKLVIDRPPADVTLGPGMSVDPTVRIDASRSLYERLRARI